MILGCDISGYQAPWVNMAGLAFVYVKATQGIYKVNANHDAQVAEARALGLIVGHYHFPAWGDPVQEAQAFIIGSQWRAGDFLVLDIENSIQTPWPADPVTWCVAFENEVARQLGIWCMDYAGPNVRAGWNWAPLAALGGGLIDPEYNPVGPSSSAPWANVAMWQNADTNQTGGDSDIFYGDRAGLTAYGTPGQVTAQGGGITPIQENDMTPEQEATLNLILSRQLENHLVTQQKLDSNHLIAMQKADSNHALEQGSLDHVQSGVEGLTAKIDPAAINTAITNAVNAALPALVTKAVAAAMAANPPATPNVDAGSIAEAVFQRLKAQADKA